ncbi:hypothetical protein HYR54_12965 [Candidatus Acetothermia bacterium]|nr:hypothetical protein [Candidatus Acetothermia bacterium]
MFKQQMAVGLLAIVLVSAWTTLGWAQPGQVDEAPSADSFWYEALGGSIGALAGGFGGAILGAIFGYNVNATVEPVVLRPTSQGLVLVGLKTQLSI